MALPAAEARIASSRAMACVQAGEINDAIALFRKVIALCPEEPAGYNNLAAALGMAGRTLEVIPVLRRALELRPDYAPGHQNLGNALKDCGDIAGAIASYDKALALEPDHAPAHSNRLFALHFHPGYDMVALNAEHRRWAQHHADRLADRVRSHPNDRSPDRRLRIGYVSPDFCQHVVGGNLRPLFRERDRGQFDVFCYSSVRGPDALTEELRRGADVWRNAIDVSDAALADIIRDDAIDILVDLSVHTDNNRLLTFAAKPAPVQITYLGYCGTTGLAAMDFRISDPYLDPPGEDAPYVEQTLRLPRTYWCYQPGSATPDPGPLPCLRNGEVTFGCLNNFAKVSGQALTAWAEIMRIVPGSRLMLHAPSGPGDFLIHDRLLRAGLPLDRVRCIGRKTWREYIALYREIDIALDPFPFGGGITTCDALWMGVPVVTLRGRTAVGRGGTSILSNIQMQSLIALDTTTYRRIAVDLARSPAELVEIRRTLRARIAASPLMDASGFARDMESVYRRAWHAWIRRPAR